MNTLFELEASRSRRQADRPRTVVEPGLQPSRRHDPPEWGPHRHTARCRRGGTAARVDPPARPAGGAGVFDPALGSSQDRRRALRADKLADLDIGDAFTAGTRLHTFSGVVRVETIYNGFDFARSGSPVSSFGTTASRRQSSGVSGTRRSGHVDRAWLCFRLCERVLRRLVVYKEVDAWPPATATAKSSESWPTSWTRRSGIDPLSRAHHDIAGGHPCRAAPQDRRRTAERALSVLDRLLLAPVRSELDRLAPMALPVMLTGSPGTGRSSGGALPPTPPAYPKQSHATLSGVSSTSTSAPRLQGAAGIAAAAPPARPS